jgi:hypothetical protein
MSESRFSGDGPDVHTSARRALINSVTGERVEVLQSAVRSLNAGRANVHQSAVQQLAGESVTVEQSAVLRVRGNDVSLRECAALGALGASVSAENCRTVFLCAPSVRGNVQALVTPRTAFALGLGFFFGRQVVRLAGRLLKRP